MEKNKAIGIFDSGVGGLTVLKEVSQTLPSEDIVYLGDTARVPYGTKSKETVLKYTIQNTLFLLDQGVKAIVIACNTASAYGLEALQHYFNVPVIGVVEPGAQSAVGRTRNKKIGVVGTEGTVKSQAYQKALIRYDPQVEVLAKACPLLVPMAEEGLLKGEVVNQILTMYLNDFKKTGIDTMILGCTHYPLFREAFTQVLGDKIQLVDSATETAQVLATTLKKEGIVETQKKEGEIYFFSTDSPERMQKVGQLFLGREIKKVQKVEIV